MRDVEGSSSALGAANGLLLFTHQFVCWESPTLLSNGCDEVQVNGRQPKRFLILYAFAAAGGSAAYAPLLTVILPARLSDLAGNASVSVMSYAAFAGAIAASLSNILFGWLSDLTKNRHGWIVVGLGLSCGLLIAISWVVTVPQLLVVLCLWQAALNMMLSPLAALAGDYVPDEQKGLLGGLLAFSPGIGAAVGALVTLPGVGGIDVQLPFVALIVATLVLPVVISGRPRPMPQLMYGAVSTPPLQTEQSDRVRPKLPVVWRMWLARLGVQIAEASLFAFLLIWLRELDRAVTANHVAIIFTIVLLASVPIAILTGRWSDRMRSPFAPLAAASAVAAMGLAILTASSTKQMALVGYAAFGIGAAVFLALHASQTLRVLPRPEHRGRDLGFFNLTNTIPSLVMPGLILALVPLFGFPALFAVLAGLVGLSAALLATAQLR